ncbi:MAG: hypothetical protein VKL39_15580 [Leptolyngbyaceae bacterium]|nr:hypothetical protein [Leptolyngbyaceae bacterium]
MKTSGGAIAPPNEFSKRTSPNEPIEGRSPFYRRMFNRAKDQRELKSNATGPIEKD